MATYYSEPVFPSEPLQRFYPAQGTKNIPPIPSAPSAVSSHPASKPRTPLPVPASAPAPVHHRRSRKKSDDASYLMHRHPLLLQRLYEVADTFLTSYRTQDFIYDTYPDYLSLGWMRDRLLRENNVLTEEFLSAGCPIEWLNILTDAVISELLCRKRCAQRNPRGEASTTSVQSPSRS